MDDDVDPAPAVRQNLERAVERCVVGHVHVHQQVGPDLRRQRLDALAERLALIGKGKLGAIAGQRLRDPPRDRAIVRDTHDQRAFPGKQSAHSCQSRYLERTSVALVPPKPKLLDRTLSKSTPSIRSIAISSGRISGSSSVMLAEAEMKPSCIISSE